MATTEASLSIQIDYRETDLCEALDKLGVAYTKANLVVGDIAYTLATEPTPIFFCERKTYSDLNSSIVSGRYRDQRARLLESKVPFAFILEGANHPRMPQNSARTLGALENLAVRHRICVIPTRNIEETAKCVSHLQKKIVFGGASAGTLGNGDSGGREERREPVDSGEAGKIVHRKTKIMHNIFSNQLTCISGVSESTAKSIEAMYPTMASLLKAYDAQESEGGKETLLQDISLQAKVTKSDKNPGKARRLGPVLSRRIYRAHHGLPFE